MSLNGAKVTGACGSPCTQSGGWPATAEDQVHSVAIGNHAQIEDMFSKHEASGTWQNVRVLAIQWQGNDVRLDLSMLAGLAHLVAL